MSHEAAIVSVSASPVTPSQLRADLARLGVASGNVLIVHSALSRLGWVAGGAQTVVLALLEAIGPEGTLVMPTHSTQLSDPANWRSPPVPTAWWPTIRAETPPFDPILTPTRSMGAVVETFRRHPACTRSLHPLTSFAALGPRAAKIVADHRLGSGLGEHSPLARLYDADARVLLLGVGHGNNTSLHLAESRANFPDKRWHREGAPIRREGRRQWVEFDELVWDDSDFESVGAAFARTGLERQGRVGAGEARLMPMRDLVDFGVRWFESERRPSR